jgi:hypothetical protein
MAGPRETGLRRAHVRAIPLLEILHAEIGRGGSASGSADFVLGIPDGRVRASLAVMFYPKVQDLAFPSDHPYVAAGLHGLAIIGRENGMEQGGHLQFGDLVFGSFSVPVPLPGDTFGWIVSDEPDCREWYCRLTTDVLTEAEGGEEGTWVARATFTDRVGMTPEEWERVADKIYLRNLAINRGVYFPNGAG